MVTWWAAGISFSRQGEVVQLISKSIAEHLLIIEPLEVRHNIR